LHVLNGGTDLIGPNIIERSFIVLQNAGTIEVHFISLHEVIFHFQQRVNVRVEVWVLAIGQLRFPMRQYQIVLVVPDGDLNIE